MSNWKLLSGVAAASIMTAAIIAPAEAQSITSSIQGQVTAEDGQIVNGATITVVHTPSGTATTTASSGTGSFFAQNLRPGGPYTITVSADGFDSTQVEDIFLTISDTGSLSIRLTPATDTRTLNTVVVTASSAGFIDVASGPAAVFSLDDLENLPAINRDIKDIIALDPRIYIDEGFNDAVQCAGANPRYNSLTLDGLGLNDQFGLNSTGYPTQRVPFSFDAINQVAVELSPIDVEYGNFTACNINAVSKSGTNEFHGGLFVDYTSDSLTGDSIQGTEIDNGTFDEYRYGFNIGGPIIKDKLFFFVAYEEFDGVDQFGFTPESAGITQADFDEVISIAEDQYGYVSGGLPTSLSVYDKKLLAKLDWNINDMHRAAFTYVYNDGNNFFPSDSGSSRLSDGNHYYEKAAVMDAYTLNFYSDWTDTFSTEATVAYQEVDVSQESVTQSGFGEVQVRVGSSTIYLGQDDSRHSNALDYNLWTYKLVGNYQSGDHFLTFGGERSEFDVFNLFVQETEGEWVFNSIEDFRNGDFSDFRYENAAGSNDPNDGAAEFGYQINTLYIQDEWQVDDALTVTAGLRYEQYTTSDEPAFNQSFFDTYGFGNDATLDGIDLLQPRLGLNYDLGGGNSLRAGLGLFSGGNPNVWISNNYSNNGVTLFEDRIRGGSVSDYTYAGGSGSVFYDVPDSSIQAVADADGRGPVNALDPNFKIPSEWKLSIGTTLTVDAPGNLGEDYIVNLDYLRSNTKDAAIVVPLDYEQIGTAPDGRPIYAGSTSDFLLTNTDAKGEANVWSASVSKTYDFGFDWSLAYAYTDSKDVSPMTSSVAFSNFANYTTSDPINPVEATSDYEIPHRITLNLGYERDFIRDLTTRFNLFGQAREGSPYSYVFGRNNNFEESFSSSRQLAYIPTGATDPLIHPDSDPAAVDALLDFIGGRDELREYRGGIAERNAFHDSWWTKFDLKISQDLPGLKEGHRTNAFMTIENVGNLLNDEWGVFEQTGFPGNVELYNASIVDNQYLISSFNENAGGNESFNVGASLWSIVFGIKYEF